MRILSFTAGAGQMLCGSCIRDNALVRELRRRGHDVRLVPLYHATRTDEENLAESRVRLGGISLFLQHAAPFFGGLGALDPLLDSRRLLGLASRLAPSTDPSQLGPLTVTMLQGSEGRARRAVERLCRSVTGERFDLVVLPNSLLLGLVAPLRAAVEAPVLVTFSGEDLFLSQLPDEDRDEAVGLMRHAARGVNAFCGVTAYHAREMADLLGIPRSRAPVVRLGVDPEGFPDAPRPVDDVEVGAAVTIGFFSRIAPEKGLDRLAKAVRILAVEEETPPLRVAAAGWMARNHRSYLEEKVRQRLRKADPPIPFDYEGVPDRAGKIAFLRRADLVAIPASFPEPKGLPAIEAMMAGTPVVVPREGAYPDLLDRTEGGILARSAAPADFAAALGEMVRAPRRRRLVGARAFERAREAHSAARMADDAEAVYAAAAASFRSRAA